MYGSRSSHSLKCSTFASNGKRDIIVSSVKILAGSGNGRTEGIVNEFVLIEIEWEWEKA